MGYLLSKLLPLLVLPLGLSLVCLVLALVFRWRWPLMLLLGCSGCSVPVRISALWGGRGTQIRRSAASAPVLTPLLCSAADVMQRPGCADHRMARSVNPCRC